MKKLLAVLCVLTFLLPGCGTVPEGTTAPPAATLPPETTAPAETTAPPETTVPTGENPVLETEPFNPEEPYFTLYIASQSTNRFVYSIAPAGTENWIPLVYTGLRCADQTEQAPHGAWAQLKYAAPYDGEECTKWRLKLECYPEIVAQWLGMSEVEGEYEVYIFEDVELEDGRTVLSWQGTLSGSGTRYTVDEAHNEFFVIAFMAPCGNCSGEFLARYTPPVETVPFAPSEPSLSIYIRKYDIFPYRYYVAPAGSEEWTLLAPSGLSCAAENAVHEGSGCAKYLLPLELFTEGTWRLKRELDTERWEAMGRPTDQEVPTVIFEDIPVYDGVEWKFSYGEVTTRDMVYCDRCSEEFRARYIPEA